MKCFKKISVVSLGLLLTAGIFFAGCSSKSASGEKIKVRFAGTEADNTPQSQMLHEVAKRLNASGKFEVEVFTAGSLSSDTDDMVTQALQGSNIVVPSDPGRISSNQKVPDFGILMAPYVLKDYKLLDKLLDTPLYKQWEQDFEKAGLKLITNNFYNGMRNFITNVPINTPADLKGLRIRGFGNNIGNGLAKYLGYAQTSIPATDIYTGVQSKTIDGTEIQTPALYGYRLYEVLAYANLTEHYMLTSSIVCGLEFFNSMPADAQALFVSTFRTVCSEYQGKVAESEVNDLADMEKKGLKVNRVDKTPFEKAVQPLYNELGFSPGLKDKLFTQLGI
ncbi:MAG: TRAP transporter substrate-binding protein DctP [Elusimicrobiota bacterium]|jgi:TRAP-type C4-dicarboxylate transport system substrate-binding protein|nr:TRAP transporter substrate-binding protein DctP [Elusimicrobiota bacterium]